MANDKLYILTKDDGVQFIVRAEAIVDDPKGVGDILITVEEVTTRQELQVRRSQLRRLDKLGSN